MMDASEASEQADRRDCTEGVHTPARSNARFMSILDVVMP